MAYTPIDKPSDYFNTVLWTGNGTDDRSITGVGFKPDLVWYKERSNVGDHTVHDVVRGAGERLFTADTSAESLDANSLQAFETDGFQIGTNTDVNGSSETYVAWNWLASNTTASNTDGSITSTVSANTTSGFSIVSYTGNGTSGATVGHGLGVAPKMVILKVRNTTGQWRVGHISASSNFSQVLNLNLTNAKGLANSIFNSTAPSSTVFTLGNEGDANGSGNTFVAYCFAEKKGFSKFGSYTGNGSATDGTFIYTGFKPAWIMTKRTDSSTGGSWQMYDNKRLGYNVDNNQMKADKTNVEDTTDSLDILSNGFKMRNSGTSYNASGASYIYMCFASNPFTTSTGIPCTAR